MLSKHTSSVKSGDRFRFSRMIEHSASLLSYVGSYQIVHLATKTVNGIMILPHMSTPRRPDFSSMLHLKRINPTIRQIVTLAIAEGLRELRFCLICLITVVPNWLWCTSQNVGGL